MKVNFDDIVRAWDPGVSGCGRGKEGVVVEGVW